ncbi:hypothetical protein D3C75_1208530 [compost metagenome]
MRRHVALVIGQRTTQALAINQQFVLLARQRAPYVLADIITVGLAAEHSAVEFLLELPGQR